MEGFTATWQDGVLRLSGELDLTADNDLLTAFRNGSNDGSEVILDLSELEFIDSTGIGALVAIAKEASPRGVVLRSPRRTVRKVIDLTRLEDTANVRVDDGRGQELAVPMTDEKLFAFDRSRLGSYDKTWADRALAEMPELYRNHLFIAKWIDGCIDRMEGPTITNLRSDDYEKGMIHALGEVAAHLRHADFVPGGSLHVDITGERGQNL